MMGSSRVAPRSFTLAVATLALSVATVVVPLVAAAQPGTSRTLDLPVVARVIVLIVLAAVFIAAVLVTPKIWHSNESEAREPKEGVDPQGRRS